MLPPFQLSMPPCPVRVGWTLPGVVVFSLFIWVICKVIYRVCFHPLASFPGPILAGLTDLWSVYHNARGRMHLEALRQHDTYGPIVRFGPNKLSVNAVAELAEIYKPDNIRKSQVYETLTPAPGAYSTLTFIDKGLHRQRRRILDQAFSSRALRAFEPKILREAEIFLRVLADKIPSDSNSQWSEPLNMTPVMRHLAYDIMGEFGFGKSFDMQTTPRNRFMMRVTEGALVVSGVYCQYPKLKKYGLGRLLGILGKGSRAQYGRMIQALIAERLSEPKQRRADLLHFMTDQSYRQGGEEPTPVAGNGASFTDQVWAESRFLFIAGAETMGTFMASTLFYLSRNPPSYDRLVQTLRMEFASAEAIQSGTSLSSCAYLWACLNETLRISPPLSTILWREVLNSTVIIDGKAIPKGTDIGFSAYPVHHDKEIFPDPYTFRPERWLNDEHPGTAARLAAQQRAFYPFGTESRRCAGDRLAYLEVAIVIARTLWTFDLRRPASHLDAIGGGKAGASDGRGRAGEFQLYEHISSRHDGPYLEWSRRSQL